MKKKKANLKKRKTNWLPARGAKRNVLIIVFAAVIAVVGYIAISQTFAATKYFTFYSQYDSRWANSRYPYIPGTRDQSDIAIKNSGCGPTSMAMVATALKKTNTPPQIAAYYGPRFHTSDGTLRSVYPVFARDYGLKYADLGSFIYRNNRVFIQNKLKSANSLVIIHAGPGSFTGSAHIMVMRAYNSTKDEYLIADPKNNRSQWYAGRYLLEKANLNNAYSFTR